MKVLITGANGQLGRALISQLKGVDICAADRRLMDIKNRDQTEKVIYDYKPDIIIHTAAFTDVDLAETDIREAFSVNALGTYHVAMACNNIQAKMIYISTDYVFDGNLNYMDEYSIANPCNVYGRSKLAGEVITQNINKKFFIVRTAWLYGTGHNFVNRILDLAEKKDRIKVVNDQTGSPTYAIDLAEAIIKLMQTDYYGIYHIINQGSVTWYDFARKILEIAKKNIQVIPQSTLELNRPAIRPKHSVLNNTLTRLVTHHEMRDWQSALYDYLEKFKV